MPKIPPLGMKRVPSRLPRQIMVIVGTIAIVAMMANTALEVVMRNVLNSPVPGTLELVTYWYMVPIAFIGMWLAEYRGEQIYVTLLVERMSAPLYVVTLCLGALVMVAYLGVVAWFTWDLALDKFAINEYVGVTRLPVWPLRFLVPVALVAVIIALINQTWSHVVQKLRGEEVNDDAATEAGLL